MPVEPFYLALGRRVHEHRVRRGLTQQRLGELLAPPGTRASIGNIEAGKQRVLAHTLAQLARALDVRVEDLLPIELPAPPIENAVAQELRAKLNLSDAVLRSIEERLGMPQE